MVEKPEPNENPFTSNLTPNCSISAHLGENPLVSLSGDIDLGSAPKIYSFMLQVSDKGKKPLILDLEKVNFMDSSGLQILLRLREKLQQQFQHLLLVKPQPQIKRLFQLTGFDKIFPFFSDTEQANSFLKFHQRQQKGLTDKGEGVRKITQ